MSSAIIGIMSGSSLDGLDMALCRFDDHDGNITWVIEEAKTVSFPAGISEALKNAHKFSGFDLMKLDATFGTFIGLEIKAWMKDHALNADLIASHGHTVFHEPSQHFTTQIGNGAQIAHETGLDTITSFRAADVASGGQGAPFAPVADKALFQGYQAYINLGGIANISIFTADGKWKAWDIGPCNQPLNHLAQKIGHPYDHYGQSAESGNIIKSVVDRLISMYPYNDGRPRGMSNAEVKDSWIQYIDQSTADIYDLLSSVTEAIAILIHSHLQSTAGQQIKILVTGGGALNVYLMKRLNSLSTPGTFSFDLPSPDIIKYKECVLMAYLGYLTLHQKPYGIRDITGASADTIGGAMYRACR